MFESIRNDLNSVSPPAPSAPPDVTFTALTNLLTELDGMLKEPYRFDVFAPGSINYGLLLNYRQHWQPQSYQVGNLVSTIPLAPQETRRYTTKSVVNKPATSRKLTIRCAAARMKSSDTWREDREVVERARIRPTSSKMRRVLMAMTPACTRSARVSNNHKTRRLSRLKPKRISMKQW